MVRRRPAGALAPLAVMVLCLGCSRSGSEQSVGGHDGPQASTTDVEIGAAPPARAPAAESGGDLDPGREVYTDHCLRCHGETGLGDGPDAASLYTRPANLQEHVAHHSDKDLAAVIRGGRALMPAFGHLGEQDVVNLIGYLRRLSPSTEDSGHSH
jgi:mono/diheme cytochrome c family protein